MKFYLKSILSVLALAVILGYASCKPGGDDGPSVEEVQLGKLSRTWKVVDVVRDGDHLAAEYADFELTLSGTAGATTFNYTKKGGPDLTPWPSAGTWKFGTNPETDIIRDPAPSTKTLDMNYVVTDTQLEITFDYNGAGEPTRTSEVKGSWTFTLTKK